MTINCCHLNKARVNPPCLNFHNPVMNTKLDLEPQSIVQQVLQKLDANTTTKRDYHYNLRDNKRLREQELEQLLLTNTNNLKLQLKGNFGNSFGMSYLL